MTIKILLEIIKEATKAVPFVKYALGIAGLVAVITLIKAYQINFQVAVWGTIILIFLMVVLFIAASASNKQLNEAFHPSTLLLWSVEIIFIGIICLLTSCVFFKKPLDLHSW